MNKGLKVLKEVGIALIILLAIAATMAFLFIDKIPIAVEIPEADAYISVNRADFIVATNGIEDAQNETVVYQSTTQDLEIYSDEYRYTSGKVEPLTNPTPGKSDIPTDIIVDEQPSGDAKIEEKK